MSKKEEGYSGSSFWQLILVIPGTILALTLLISLFAHFVKPNDTATSAAPAATATSAEADKNIKPVAEVALAVAEAGPHVDKSGEEVVKAVCSACHTAGLMNAPKIGDAGQWGPRIAQGYETLINHAINGIRTMPAKGGNADLTEGEVANAVAFMANQAGANFTPPKATNSAENPDATTKPEPAAAPVKSEAAPQAAAEEPAKIAAAATGKSGEEVYKAVCAMCHATGLMSAPKFGDKEQWGPRVAQGYDTLVSHAVNGIRAMPAKGGNPSLSDAEVAAAVKYMANNGGASF
jgi:cytochrome c5